MTKMTDFDSVTDIPILAVSSGKGGMGKTTTTIALATLLVKCGWTVAVADADVLQPNAHLVAGVANRDDMLVTANDAADLSVNIPNAPGGFMLLSPLTSPKRIGLNTMFGLIGHSKVRPDIILVDCAPGWTDAHATLFAREPIGWLLPTQFAVSALSDHVQQVKHLGKALEKRNKEYRDSDGRRNWDHLPTAVNIGVVELFAGQPTLSAVVPSKTVAEIAGDDFLGALPVVTDFADLVDSPELMVVADWVQALLPTAD